MYNDEQGGKGSSEFRNVTTVVRNEQKEVNGTHTNKRKRGATEERKLRHGHASCGSWAKRQEGESALLRAPIGSRPTVYAVTSQCDDRDVSACVYEVRAGCHRKDADTEEPVTAQPCCERMMPTTGKRRNRTEKYSTDDMRTQRGI